MSKILAIDTSTTRAKVALSAHGTPLSQRVGDENTHSEELIALIDQTLAESGVSLSELDTLAVGVGPGSFTGLRIGMATMKAMAFALHKELIGISSLKAAAFQTYVANQKQSGLYLTLLDARRGEVFVALYRGDSDELNAVSPESVMAPDKVTGFLAEHGHESAPLILAGNAFVNFPSLGKLGRSIEGAAADPQASAIALLASAECEEHPQLHPDWHRMGPNYVRASEAEIRFPEGNPGGTFRPPTPKIEGQ